jgi:iron complex outermembrane receptor protein
MLNAVTTANTLNYGGRTESIWNLSKGKLFAGADYRYEAAEGTRTREMLMGPMQGNTLRDNVWQDSYIQKAGLFGEYQLQKGAVTYQAGFRFNFNYAGMQNPAPEFENVSNTSNTTQLNPSISLGLQHEVSGSLIWGVWLGSAQRSGSLAERYINFFPIGQDPYEMVGNPDLDPERNHELDVNLSISRKTWRMQVNGYASVVQNYISSLIDTTLAPRMPSSPGVRYFTNLDLAFRTGFEVSFTHNLPLKLHQQLELAYGIGQDLETTFPLPEIAPLDARYSLYGSYFKDRFVPKLRLRYVAEQNRIAEEFGETKTPDFFTVDLHLALVSKSFLRVNFGVNNLFDVGYYEHLNRSVRGSMQPIFEPGRSFILSLTFDFSNPQKVRK